MSHITQSPLFNGPPVPICPDIVHVNHSLSSQIFASTMFKFLFIALLAAGTAFASPATRTVRCYASKATLTLPASQPSGTPLATPSGNPSFIGIGVGVQNYTCGTTGTYTSVLLFCSPYS